MASSSLLILLACIVSLALANGFQSYEQQESFFQPQDFGGYDQSLSYSGSGSGSVPSGGGGNPGSGSGSVPSGGGGSYGGGSPSGGGGGNPGSGSGSVPSGGGGYGNPGSGSGSVPSGGGGYGNPGSGSGSVPSGGGGYGNPGSGSGSVDPGTGSIPTVPSSGGIPTVPSSGGIPTVPSSGGIPTVPSVGGGTPSGTPSGCSCDFWAAHVNSWPDPLQLISTVSAVFGGLAGNTFGPSTTLLTALQTRRTDPYSQLLRQGTAAMLNAYSRPNFQYSPLAVRSHLNAALVSPQAAAVQAAKFANANRGYGVNTFCT